MPFHTYSKAVRTISSFELERLKTFEPRVLDLLEGDGEDLPHPFTGLLSPTRTTKSSILRRSIVRFQMFETYGTRCVFTGEQLSSLDGFRFAVHEGHLWPLEFDGPDVLPNVLPMACRINWLWDEGVISLRNNGTLLMAARATDEHKQLLRGFERVPFSKDPSTWPNAKFLEWHRDFIFEKGSEHHRRTLARTKK